MTSSAPPAAAPDPWPDLAGRFAGRRHLLPVRVYFEDTDFSGLVYHASYLRFMERGRSDFLRLAGIGHRRLGVGDDPLAFAVRRLAIDFLSPARIDDALEVETECLAIGGARLALGQRVRRGDTPLATAEVTVALVDAAGRPRRLPAALRAALAPFCPEPE